ncbi:MAG: hypothetical protein WCW01_02550 [Gammaproteobacteria bacterium]
MKYRKILLGQVENLPYFDKKALYQLSEQYAIKPGTLDAYIRQSLTHRDLIQLKKGMYVTNEYFQKNKGDASYAFYLANVLCQPSYVSSWAALQYYNLATEAVYTITSVTPKITRTYNNKTGNFAYHSIKKELFSDFSLIQGSFDFFIASPAKALFDLIYFKTNQFKGLHISDLEPLIEEDLRIDIDEMDPKEKEHFYNLIKKYLK